MNISSEELYFRNALDVTTEELIGATHIAMLSSGSPSLTVARVSSKPSIRRSQAATLPRHTSQGLSCSSRTAYSSPPATPPLIWGRRSKRRSGPVSSPTLSPAFAHDRPARQESCGRRSRASAARRNRPSLRKARAPRAVMPGCPGPQQAPTLHGRY
jgi:hypothetical protein